MPCGIPMSVFTTIKEGPCSDLRAPTTAGMISSRTVSLLTLGNSAGASNLVKLQPGSGK